MVSIVVKVDGNASDGARVLSTSVTARCRNVLSIILLANVSPPTSRSVEPLVFLRNIFCLVNACAVFLTAFTYSVDGFRSTRGFVLMHGLKLQVYGT